jgi:ring-1,2-phenylacetyl-CoA epoxidase subunit PaaE
MIFHELEIFSVVENTKNAVLVEFLVPIELTKKFKFQPGQHIVFDFKIERNNYRRTYSICSSPHENKLCISVKRQHKGIISNFINDAFFKGLKVNVSEPLGDFYNDGQIKNSSQIVLWAGGSGITPMLSIAKHILTVFSNKNVQLIYANNDQKSIMFEDEIEDLRNTFSGNFSVKQILSNNTISEGFFSKLFSFNSHEILWTGLSGYITNEFVINISKEFPNAVHYLCGPEKLMEICETALLNTDANSVYSERFIGSSSSISNSNKDAILKVSLHKKDYGIHLAENSLLEGMLAAKLNPPYACKMGTCGSCKATLVSGEVIVARDFALNEADRATNKILCCQSWAKSSEIEIAYL